MNKPAMLHIKIQVVEPTDDILERTSLLHAALVKAVVGTRIVRHVSSNLKKGCVEVIVEGSDVCPTVTTGSVRVDVSPVN